MRDTKARKTETSLVIVGMQPLGHGLGDFSFPEHKTAAARAVSKNSKEGNKVITLEWLRDHEGDAVRAVIANPFWKKNVYALERGQGLSLSEFLAALAGLGYKRVQTIARPGEFANRGGLVEVWPANKVLRYRVEFLGNEVDTIEAQDERQYRHTERDRLLHRRLGEELLDTLKLGDFVVHVDHGIGVFCEKVVKRPSPDSAEITYYVLEYAKGDKLLVPEDKKSKLSLYVGLKVPEVHRLGSGAWLKTRRMVRASTLLYAKELISLYARRELAKGYAFGPDDALQKEFEEQCPFTETVDQRVATDQIKQDMESDRPMERLLAGDVGFGKTEVAMRAAFKAVMAGKQVALLAPTTVLTYQHFQSFSERMRNFPVRVAMLSRLKLPVKNQQSEEAVLAGLKKGGVDIAIGTHRLLSKDVSFKDLGLLIIDEEQKFGVKQKEKLKELKANLDVLLLSATPIPRTLNLALAGLREMSVLATPPPGRMPIATYVLPDSDDMMREALSREFRRGGQSYVLWNRVETMALARRKVLELAPKRSRVATAHGKMGEGELIGVMERFRARKIDVLVATTIIENGLDFAHVNTLVVMNAARLGLSQAYQIRGRIGRGNAQAFAFFFYPGELTENAKARLEALEEFSDLGSGYRVALRDLEIRGAGNVLGKEQSGNVYRVGLNLYLSMLAEAVDELHGKQDAADSR